MPIFLKAPAHNPCGPDGKGWNRMAIGGLTYDECALRPRNAAAFMESQNTLRARWGGFDGCFNRELGMTGRCQECPLLRRRIDEPTTMQAFGDRVLFRIHPQTDAPWAMNRAEDGWGSSGRPWSWDALVTLAGWEWDGFYHDGDGEGFWMKRSANNPQPVIYSQGGASA